jgi:hypothetical protein
MDRGQFFIVFVISTSRPSTPSHSPALFRVVRFDSKQDRNIIQIFPINSCHVMDLVIIRDHLKIHWCQKRRTVFVWGEGVRIFKVLCSSYKSFLASKVRKIQKLVKSLKITNKVCPLCHTFWWKHNQLTDHNMHARHLDRKSISSQVEEHICLYHFHHLTKSHLHLWNTCQYAMYMLSVPVSAGIKSMTVLLFWHQWIWGTCTFYPLRGAGIDHIELSIFWGCFQFSSCPKITLCDTYSGRIWKDFVHQCKVLDVSSIFPVKIPQDVHIENVFFCQNPVEIVHKFSCDSMSTEIKVTSWRLSVWSIGATSVGFSCKHIPHWK